MKRSDIVPWYGVLSVAILFELLSYTKKLLIHFELGGAAVVSNIIVYAGIPALILVLVAMFFLKKRRPVSNAQLFRDKWFLTLFVVMVLLGIGLFF